MSLFDWVELGAADQGHGFDWFRGAFSVTIGDSVTGVFGGFNQHIMGNRVVLVCDPEDMLLSKLEAALPALSGLIALGAGIGGNTALTYGSSFTGNYVGPRLTVNRGPSDTKTSVNQLIHKTSPDDPDRETDEIDKATTIAAAALSFLITAVSTALDLALHFEYPNFGKQDASTGYGKTPELLKICSYTITNRLIGLLRLLEEKGSFAEFAKQFVDYGEYLLKGLGYLTLFCLAVVAIPIAVAIVVPAVMIYVTVYTVAALTGEVE